METINERFALFLLSFPHTMSLYVTFLYSQEEELRKSGEAKYFHLNDDLHVLIEVFAPPAEAYARMGHALEEIKKFLIPVSTYWNLFYVNIYCT